MCGPLLAEVLDGALDGSVEVIHFALKVVEVGAGCFAPSLADQALNGLEGLLKLVQPGPQFSDQRWQVWLFHDALPDG
jgi:hypothetical protein